MKDVLIPYKGIMKLLIRVPFWLIVCFPKSWRPRPSWSLKRCVMVNLAKGLMSFDIVESTSHLTVDTGPCVKGVWVEAAPHLVTGDVETWASIANVKPSRIPGYWFDKLGADVPVGQKPTPGEKVLYLVGCSYTHLPIHPKHEISDIARGVLQAGKHFQRAFTIEFRLSTTDPLPRVNPFPTALIDALAGYNYLIENVGFDPSDIIIEGDSMGGNLALAFTRYLVEYSGLTKIPATPGGIILLSPWADLGTSHDGPNTSSSTFSMDFLGDLNSDPILWSKQAFLGLHGMSLADTNRYISPASLHVSASFKGFPKTFIAVGGAERLYDSIVTLKERMAGDMGEGNGDGQVKYYEAPDAVHDYLMFTWYEPERTDTLQAISKWL